jgi:hypothetical protein
MEEDEEKYVDFKREGERKQKAREKSIMISIISTEL